MYVLVVFVVRIFPHSDWIYLSVFSSNAGKYWPEKLQIRTLFCCQKHISLTYVYWLHHHSTTVKVYSKRLQHPGTKKKENLQCLCLPYINCFLIWKFSVWRLVKEHETQPAFTYSKLTIEIRSKVTVKHQNDAKSPIS